MSITTDEDERLQLILETLKPIVHTLTGSSPQFVADQIKRYDQYGVDIRLSPKQWEWLENLFEKAGGAPRVAGKMRDDETEEEKTPGIDDEIPF